MLICEMVCHYKALGLDLVDALNALYKEFGYFSNSQVSFAFEGQSGMEKMASIMEMLCKEPPKDIAGLKVTAVSDYSSSIKTDCVTGAKSEINLPKSDVLAFTLDKGNSLIVRPSGTEPKIKIYLSTVGDSMENAEEISSSLKNSVKTLLGIE